MNNFYKDKVIIVTGASSGIGLASATRFASLGAKIVLAARSIDKLEKIAEEINKKFNKSTDNVLCVKTDVTKEEDCKNLVEQTVKHFGKIDVLVNNAGISMRAVFKDMDLKVMRSLMDTNFWGTVYCTKYALPYLLETKGSVVGVISTAGYVGLPARTAYSASKFAVRGFLETLRIEHLYDGLHVMIFAPGFTTSNIRNVALTADGSPQGETPRKEERMMSAERVAKIMARGIFRRKTHMVLTPLGKATLFANRRLPRVTDKMEYRMMANEPDSPLKKQ
ncbi:MAG: SDR family oxidoreductase [Lentimicrobiaceae bacterium]|nr:SDR family oxidoreductase [Lentimicrobiaceae bacterium]MBE6346290.1 SDR family oxidoreductase [Lentimicrobiaceae bacterium]